jgi:hypothetical protein
LVKDRLVKLSGYPELVDFFLKEPRVDKTILLKKGGKDKELIREELMKGVEVLEAIKSWKAPVLEKAFRNLAEKQNYHVGKFFMVTRIAITGKTATLRDDGGIRQGKNTKKTPDDVK